MFAVFSQYGLDFDALTGVCDKNIKTKEAASIVTQQLLLKWLPVLKSLLININRLLNILNDVLFRLEIIDIGYRLYVEITIKS